MVLVLFSFCYTIYIYLFFIVSVLPKLCRASVFWVHICFYSGVQLKNTFYHCYVPVVSMLSVQCPRMTDQRCFKWR